MSSLLAEIASSEYLKSAWKALNKTNKESKGLSNISIRDFENSLESNLQSISNLLLTSEYLFSDIRAVTIPKSNGKGLRPLRIGEIRDRIVQKALAMKLDNLLADKYNLNNDFSFAYRKGKNVREAIARMDNYYRDGYTIVLEADIEKFFDSVAKSELLQRIKSSLPDDTLNLLLDAAVNQRIGNRNGISQHIFEEYFESSENGIPQGNALSPLLANIYLADFDKRAKTEGLKMIRYADDFIIMSKSESEAYVALGIVKEELEEKLGLKIHALSESNSETAKTRIVDPKRHKFSFLSIRFDGNRCWVKDSKVTSIIEKITSIAEKGKVSGLLPVMTSIKNTVEGWIAAYHFVDLTYHLEEIDKHINRQLYLTFLNLGFKLDKKCLERTSFKGKSNEIWVINKIQRKNSGIPLCNDIWKRLSTELPSFKGDVEQKAPLVRFIKADLESVKECDF